MKGTLLVFAFCLFSIPIINAQLLNITIDSPLQCYGDSNGVVTAYGNGPGFYQWSDAAGLFYQDTSGTVSGLAAGTYFVEFSDTNIVFWMDTVILSQPPLISSFDTLYSCDSLFFQSSWYFSSVTVIDTLTAFNSCDSIATTFIDISDTISPTALCQNLTVYLDSLGNGSISINAYEIANSSAEFSGVQGQNGWEYGVYPAFNAAAYTQLTGFTGFVWNNPGAGAVLDFPQIDSFGGHPQFEGLRWAVRRWVSDHNGLVTISGDFYDRDLGGGDGANVRVFKNGAQVYEYLNIPGNAVPYSISMNVLAGDSIDFIIDPKFDASNDDTHFTALIMAEGISNGSYDNCTIASAIASKTNFSCADFGLNQVMLTVTDGYGNTNSCTAMITVAGASGIRNDTLSSCDSVQFNSNWYFSSVVLADTVPVSGGCDSITFTHIIISDTTNPMALCQNHTVYLDSSGQAALTAASLDAGSTDNCSVASLSLSVNSFDCSSLGVNAVTLIVTDNFGNSGSCLSSVTLLDTIAPTVSCKNLTIQLDSSGNALLLGEDTEIANSSAEFSGVQGQDGWEYGAYPAFSASSYAPLPNYTGSVWNNPGTTLDFPQIDPNGGHPQFEGLRWAVRRWVSDHNGPVILNGDFYDRDLGGGDGANVRIFRNGIQVYEYLDIPGTSVPYSLNLHLTYGDKLDFIIDPKFDAANDDTHFSAVITAQGINDASLDNCDIASAVPSLTAFSCADIGSNTVTLTVTDSSGNSSSCQASVLIDKYIHEITDSVVACNSYTWIDGNTYTSDNDTSTFALSGSICADTLIRLKLSINTADTSVIQNGTIFTANASNASFQWLDCNGNIPLTGDTSQTFNAAVNGSYALVVSQNGCVDTSACFTVTGLGFTERGAGHSFSLYPNPTDGMLNIESGSLYEEIRVSVLSVNGILLRKVVYKNASQLKLNVKDLLPGMYLIELQDEKGQRSFFKVVRRK